MNKMRAQQHFFLGCFVAFVLQVDGSSAATTSAHFTREFGVNVASSQKPYGFLAAKTLVVCAAECHTTTKCQGFTAYDTKDGSVKCEFVETKNSVNDMRNVTGASFFSKSSNDPTGPTFTTTEQKKVAFPVPIQPADCWDILQSGSTESNGYNVYINKVQWKVFCDMETDGGGWTVLLRREDGSVDFDRDWADYREGFGDVDREHWAGNDFLHAITSQKTYEVRFDLMAFTGEYRFAHHDSFKVDSEGTKYRLQVGSYSGNATDAFGSHDNRVFTTVDRDNDDASTYNCADYYHGGWWYGSCSGARLTGIYGEDVPDDGNPPYILKQGILWAPWLGVDAHPSFVEMKIRPVK